MKDKVAFHVIANAALGSSLSGGDRIFIECARGWAEAGHKVHVYVWEEGYEMCKRNKLDNIKYIIWSASRFKGFGRVILEALSCGTPVIASNRGGIPEALDKSVGTLIEPDVNKIVQTIESPYEHPKKLVDLRRNCRIYAIKRFSEDNAKIMEDAYWR